MLLSALTYLEGMEQEPHALTNHEKVLYHQIHPVKLTVDIGLTPVALYFFWIHWLLLALVVSLVPSIVASALIVRFVDLTKYAERVGSGNTSSST